MFEISVEAFGAMMWAFGFVAGVCIMALFHRYMP